MDFDAFSIFLVEGNLLKHHFSQRYDERVKANNILIGTGITGHAVALREPILVRDTLLDQRYLSTHADIRSEIATPLIVKDRVIGVLDLESDRIGYFTEDHKQTLSLLAPQIAIAIDNARLYEEVENRRWKTICLLPAGYSESSCQAKLRKFPDWKLELAQGRQEKSLATSTTFLSTARITP